MLNTLSEIRYPCSGNLSSLSTIYGCHSGKVSQFYLKGKGTKCLVRRMTGLMTNSSQKWRVDLSPRQGTYSMAAFFLRLPSLVANFLKWRPVATQEKSCRRIIRKWSAWQLCLAYHNPRLIYGESGVDHREFHELALQQGFIRTSSFLLKPNLYQGGKQGSVQSPGSWPWLHIWVFVANIKKY